MKILTWNINGIRAVQREKKSLKNVLDSLGADVICLQETKVTRDMLDEPTAVVDGYDSYFSYSRKKTGYSGTANYCKTGAIPTKAEEGLTGKLTTTNNSSVCHYGNTTKFSDEELNAIDDEGRCVITQHEIRLPIAEMKEVAIINVYVPLAGDREDRHKYKLEFLTILQARAEALLKNGVHVIILGDINTTHLKLDNCDTQPDSEFLRKSSRIWLNGLLQPGERDKDIPLIDANLADIPMCNVSGGLFSDIFRRLHPHQENAFTNWCSSTGARQTNYGRRLDYILMDTDLANYVTECNIMPEIEGSDHCPVIVTLNCISIPSFSSPSLCSKFMPEFRGQQQKLSSFFTKTTNKPSQMVQKSDSSMDQSQNVPKDKDSICSISEKSEHFNSLKRHSTLEQRNSSKKTKLKKGESDSSLVSKQITLTSFFTKTNKGSGKQDCQFSKGSSASIMNNSNISKRENIDVKHVSTTEIEQTGRENLMSERDSLCVSMLDDKTVTNFNIDGPQSSNTDHSPDNRVLKIEEVKDQSTKSEDSNSSSQILSLTKCQTVPTSSASAWKGILGGLPPPPLCPGHKEPSVLRTVKKTGHNKNKQFYVCARPDGAPGNKESRCNFFQWVIKKK